MATAGTRLRQNKQSWSEPSKAAVIEPLHTMLINVAEWRPDILEEHAEEFLLPVRSVLKCRSEVGVCRA